MAAISGRGGKITWAGGAVADVTGWSYTFAPDLIEDTSMSNNATSLQKTFMQGNYSATGQLNANYDATDADGQSLMLVAITAATLVLYPQGDGSGKRYITGTAQISNVQISSEVNGKISFSASFTFNTQSWATV